MKHWKSFFNILTPKTSKNALERGELKRNIAAIRWLPRGKTKLPVIQYMLIDTNLEYLISPREIVVTQVKETLDIIFQAIEIVSKNELPLAIHYKSIVKGYWAHRRDSGEFHRQINQYIVRKRYPYHKTAYFLRKEHLKRFKHALYFLDIDCKTPGCAYVAYLWIIALRVTRGRLKDAIKMIWKQKYGIARLSKETLRKFQEFYTLL